MKRLFNEHNIRPVKYLDTEWSYCVDRENKGEDNLWFYDFPDSRFISVPSVWNFEKDLLTYEGKVWFNTTFFFEGGTARLVFEGVMTQCKVWVDGNYLGYHYGGFTQFDFIIPDLREGYHNLTVMVDNSFDEYSIPQKNVDWFHYGGITRSVSLEKLSGICIQNFKFDYQLNENLTQAQCWVTLSLHNSDNNYRTDLVKINLDGKNIFSKEVTMGAKTFSEFKSNEFTCTDICLWDTDNPKLYTIEILTSSDDLIDKIGFRKIEVKDKKILLNKKELKLRGVNRHEDFPALGMSITPPLMKQDIDIIIDMSCNCIRGSHYPNSKIFLDMLDSTGILFWSEIPFFGTEFSEESLGNENIVNRGLQMHREMVDNYYNHPSIILWGMHNEIKSDTDNGYKLSKLYYSFLKENGGNRLVTYASYKPKEDICFKFCDVISLNQYYGWYYGNVNDWKEFLDTFEIRRNELGFENKPILISEFGCAAAYGHHTFENVKWTEEYQSNLIENSLNIFRNFSYISGTFIWQFCDVRSDRDLDRARTYNNKGLLNEYRKPKMAYFRVKDLYKKFKEEQNHERTEKL